VTNGTATGCAVTSGVLTSQSSGTCIVTATKAADANYDAISSNATTIELAMPARPSRVTTNFTPGKSTLSSSARAALRALAKKLLRGASVTVTGYAPDHSTLARRRAIAVADYLKSLVKVNVVVKTVTKGSSNEATVVTTKQ
jgi:outer membrane protein OmpA-like peptidoglycan-associated protein